MTSGGDGVDNKKEKMTEGLTSFVFRPSWQCPFYDDYIISLHNKIKNKPVEFPDK